MGIRISFATFLKGEKNEYLPFYSIANEIRIPIAVELATGVSYWIATGKLLVSYWLATGTILVSYWRIPDPTPAVDIRRPAGRQV